MKLVMNKKTGDLSFLSVITLKVSVYSAPMGSSPGRLMVVSLIVVDIEESINLVHRIMCVVSQGYLQNYLSQNCRIQWLRG